MVQFGFQAPTKSWTTSNVKDVMSWIWNIGTTNKQNDALSKIWTIKWVNTGWSAWVQSQLNSVAPVVESAKAVTIGRLNPKNPVEDDAILWASEDIFSGKPVESIFKAYPELNTKWDAIMSYLTDVQDTSVSEKKLYDMYPELSNNVKTQLRAQIKPQVEIKQADQELADNPLSIWENIGAWALWIAQWLGDVWYNVIGKKANEIWDFISNKIKDTKLAKEVTDFAVSLIWANPEDVRNFQDSEALRKLQENTNSSENNANILRWIGWRKLEQSTAGNLWKKTWQFIWEQALSLAAWWVAGWAAKSLAWTTAKTLIWQKLKSATVGAIAWLAWTEANTLASKWEFATSKQLKTWALFGGIGWALFAWKILPKESKVWDYLLEWLTKKEYADRAAKMGLKTNFLGKVKNVFSKTEKWMIDATKWVVNPTKTSIYNMNKLNGVIKSDWDKLTNLLSTYTQPINKSKIITSFNKIQPPQSLKSDATLNKTYQFVKDKYINAISKTDWTPLSIIKARQELDRIVEKEIPGLWSSPASNPMKMAIQDLRRVPNEIVNEYVWNNTVKNILNRQSNMYNAIDLLKTRAEKVWTTALSRFINKNKELLKIGGLIVGWAAGSRSIDAASQSQ